MEHLGPAAFRAVVRFHDAENEVWATLTDVTNTQDGRVGTEGRIWMESIERDVQVGDIVDLLLPSGRLEAIWIGSVSHRWSTLGGGYYTTELSFHLARNVRA